MWHIWYKGEMRAECWLENVKETRLRVKPRRRREDIKIELKKIGWEGAGWIDVAQGRGKRRAAVSVEIIRRAPYSVVNCWPAEQLEILPVQEGLCPKEVKGI
jgi:hypothetical protein